MNRDPGWLLDALDPTADDLDELSHTARELERRGLTELAATAWDRAFGLAPHDAFVQQARARVLDALALEVDGLRFRYIPAGTFLMGRDDGDADERPVHPVRLGQGYWLAEVPMSWADACRVLGWAPPPDAAPPEHELEGLERMARFHLYEEDKIRLQYCEDTTRRAGDWHAHAGMREDLFGAVDREEPDAPPSYATRPMVAVSWQHAEEVCARLVRPGFVARLPSEAQWEKAARGGLVGRRYAWGDEPPGPHNCDFDHFGDFRIAPSRRFAPNGYGLYAMCGGVWEWTRDWYDASAYPPDASLRREPESAPLRGTGASSPGDPDFVPLRGTGASSPAELDLAPRGVERALRGGSWSDAAAAVTVSMRMSRHSRSWRDSAWGRHETPNIGFRPVLERTAPPGPGSGPTPGPT